MELISFLQFRISMLFLLANLLIFLPLRYRKRASLFIAAACFLVTGLQDIIIFFALEQEFYSPIMNALEILVVQGVAFGLSRYRDFRALFTGFVASNYVLPGNVLASILIHGFHKPLWGLAVQILVSGTFLAVLVWQLRKPYLEEMEAYGNHWKILCFIPALFYLTLDTLVDWSGDLTASRRNWVPALLLLALMAVVYILVVRVLAQRRKQYELNRTRDFLEVYASGLRREIEAVQREQERMAVLRHDSRHFYRMLDTYLQNGENQRAQELLKKMDADMQEVSPQNYCNNVAVNGILSANAARARCQGTQFECRAILPETLENIQEYELAAIVSNLTENALNATEQMEKEQERRVEVFIHPQKQQLFVEVKNTFAEKPEISQTTGLPVSHRGEEHGYGMRSVQMYAERHQGFLHCQIMGDEFCVTVLV